MPDRLGAMAMLLRVVDVGSLTAGARALDMPVATVSRRIADLEQRLGAEPLIRSPRGLALTDAGTAYLDACRRILDEVHGAERSAAGEFAAPCGTLTVTAPIVFGRLHALPSVVAFLRTYPEVDLRLDLSDRPVNLREEHLDLAVRIGPLADSALVARLVGEVRQVVCASPAYLDAHGRPAAREDVAAADCVTFRQIMGRERWRFGDGGGVMDVAVRARLSATTGEAAVDAAEAGLAFTRVLSYEVADAVRSGRLEIVLRDREPAPWPVSLVYEPRALIPQKLRAFLDFAAPRIAATLAAS